MAMNAPAIPMKPVTAIYLTSIDGHVLVEALVSGPFGVHVTPGADHFSVTHVGSGFSVAKGFATANKAAAFATSLARLNVDWDFADPATIKDWSKYRREQILKLIVEHGGEDPKAARQRR